MIKYATRVTLTDAHGHKISASKIINRSPFTVEIRTPSEPTGDQLDKIINNKIIPSLIARKMIKSATDVHGRIYGPSFTVRTVGRRSK